MAGTEAPRLRLLPELQSSDVSAGLERPLLNQVFAAQVFDVTRSIEDELPAASLVAYSDLKRLQLDMHLGKAWRSIEGSIGRIPPYRIEELARKKALLEEYRQRQARLRVLPPSPDRWKEFVSAIDAPHKRVLIQAITGKLKEGGGSWGKRWIDSGLTVGDLREIEVSEDFASDPYSPVTDTFLSRAF